MKTFKSIYIVLNNNIRKDYLLTHYCLIVGVVEPWIFFLLLFKKKWSNRYFCIKQKNFFKIMSSINQTLPIQKRQTEVVKNLAKNGADTNGYTDVHYGIL